MYYYYITLPQIKEAVVDVKALAELPGLRALYIRLLLLVKIMGLTFIRYQADRYSASERRKLTIIKQPVQPISH